MSTSLNEMPVRIGSAVARELRASRGILAR